MNEFGKPSKRNKLALVGTERKKDQKPETRAPVVSLQERRRTQNQSQHKTLEQRVLDLEQDQIRLIDLVLDLCFDLDETHERHSHLESRFLRLIGMLAGK